MAHFKLANNQPPLPNKISSLTNRYIPVNYNFDDDFLKQLQLSQGKSLFTQIIALSPNSVFILDANFNYICLNDNFIHTIGLQKQQLLGKPFSFYPLDKLPPLFAASFQSIVSELRQGRGIDTLLSIPRSGKEEIFIKLSITPFALDEHTLVYIGYFTNLSANVEIYDNLMDMLAYDKLTGLQNREYFYQSLGVAIEGIKQQPERLIYLYIIRLNIDKLHLFNDSLGTQLTDVLIQQLVQRLRQLQVEHVGVKAFSRFSGGNFAIFIRTHDKKFAIDYVKKLSELLDIPFLINHQQLYVKLSIGVSQYPENSLDADNLIVQAEKALDKAAMAGGNVCVWYNHLEQDSPLKNEHLLSAFHRGLKAGEIVPFFQPKILFNAPEKAMFEALVRWQHPKYGLLPPNHFLGEVLESLSQPLFEHMLLACIEHIIDWRKKGFCVSVCLNIDARQLIHPRFLIFIEQLFSTYQLFTGYIQFELTEIANLNNFEQSKQGLERLSKLGFEISLDDFGVGFSTLDYLVNLPISAIKIDKSFCENLLIDEKKQQLVKAMIAIAHTLNLEVITEGVETQEQLAFIKNNGGDGIQGFLISPPLSAEQTLRWLDKHFIPNFDFDSHWQALFDQPPPYFLPTSFAADN